MRSDDLYTLPAGLPVPVEPHLPFELLSDERFALIHALRLPSFELGGMRFVQRTTLILHDGTIEKVFYPVFPPDRNAADVVAWLAANR